VSEFDAKDTFVLMMTKKGILKKTELSAYSNPRKAGVRAINIDEGDSLISVTLTDDGQDVFLATVNGLSLRFPVKSVRPIGRVGRGVIGIRLNPGDSVIGMEILRGTSSILTLTENGYGKKTRISDYRVGSRGNKGIFTIKTSKRNGKVVGIVQVENDQEVMLITQFGKLIRLNLDKMRNIGRLTQGVRMILLESDERVVSITKIVEAEGSNGDGDANGNGSAKEGGNGTANGKNGDPPPEKLN
jgi:DNA gyrase subunit A